MTVNRRLNQIVWQRYKWIVLSLVALIVVVMGFALHNSVDTTGIDAAKLTYTEFVQSEKDSAKADHRKIGSVSRATYEKNNIKIKDVSIHDGTFQNAKTALVIFSLGAILLGIFTNMYDMQTKFNEFIFSSSFSRKRIFLKKIGLMLLPALLTFIVGSIITTFVADAAISVSNPNFISDRMIHLFLDSSQLIALYSVGLVVGVLVRRVVASVVTALGFTGSALIWFAYFEGFIFDQTQDMSNTYYLVLGFIYLIAGLLMIVMAVHYFNKLSLEQDSPYLQFDYLKLPLLIFTTAYIAILMAVVNYDTIGEKIGYGLISGCITVIVAYIVIYRPQNISQKLQRIFSKNKK